jgi:hypothetical protein
MSTALNSLRFAFAGVVLVAGCLYSQRNGKSGLEALPVAEQGMFRRCQQPLAARLCAGADDAAQARWLSAQALTYARQSEKMRRRWLEMNQCPGSVIDGPDQMIAAAEPKAAAPSEVPPKVDEPPAPAPAVAAAPGLLASGAACQPPPISSAVPSSSTRPR